MTSECFVVAAAGVAIFNEQAEILLGRHRHDRRWATFGGRVEADESARAAAIREVREELGLTLTTKLAQLGVFGGSSMYTVTYPGWGATTYEVTMFATIVIGRPDVQVQADEIAEARWISLPTLDQIALATDMTEIVPAAVGWYAAR